MAKKQFDIHQTITDKIIAAIEAGAGEFVMPWHRKKGGLKPRNVFSGNHYQGINILALWVEAQGMDIPQISGGPTDSGLRKVCR